MSCVHVAYTLCMLHTHCACCIHTVHVASHCSCCIYTAHVAYIVHVAYTLFMLHIHCSCRIYIHIYTHTHCSCCIYTAQAHQPQSPRTQQPQSLRWRPKPLSGGRPPQLRQPPQLRRSLSWSRQSHTRVSQPTRPRPYTMCIIFL